MSTWRNKAKFCRFLDQAVNNGRLGLVDDIFAEDFVGYFPEWPGPQQGRVSVKAWVEVLRCGFANVNAVVEGNWMAGEVDFHHVGKGVKADRLAAYVVLRATHTGEYLGLEPTNERVEVPQVHLLQFREGQVIQDVVITDRLALLPEDEARTASSLLTARRPAMLI